MTFQSASVCYLYCFLLTIELASLYKETADDNKYYNYYCDLECPSQEKHIACSTCGLSDTCGKNAKMFTTTEEERWTILDEHNRLRNKIASGEETQLGKNTSNCMLAMSYSVELEFLAQCWANHCTTNAPECMMSMNFGAIGTNLLYIQDEMSGKDLFMTTIRQWYAEVSSVDMSVISNYEDHDSYRNFAQMVWDGTHLVGCGRTGYKGGQVVVCNYAPLGNQEGEEVYRIGSPCAGCDKASEKNKIYKSLCGFVLVDDSYRFPFKMCSCTLRTNGLLYLVLVPCILKEYTFL